jgi:type VI secretion system protein ImpG
VTEELYPYYNRELAFLRSMGADFASRYRKIAARLELDAKGSKDPHVERLLQGVALLNARVQHKLDDDLPEIAESLLSVLYPHCVRPTPSMCMLQFRLGEGSGELAEGHLLPPGTQLDTEEEPHTRATCRFETCYPVQVWPCTVGACEFLHRPFHSPASRRGDSALSALRIQLRTTSRGVSFAKLKIPSLRFYLHAGETPDVYRLYELLFTRVVEVIVAASVHDDRRRILPAACLRPVGFSRDEALLPYDARSFAGYRLLNDFFALPQKFLFFEIADLPSPLVAQGDTLEIFVLFGCKQEELQESVSRGTLRLGCTPAVNLYRQRLEPQILNQTRTEYRVDPPRRMQAAEEIFSIDAVESTSAQGTLTKYVPFYCFKHAADRDSQRAFWHASRRPRCQALPALPEGDSQGQEIYLSFVDLDFSPAAPADAVLHVQATCCNGDLPSKLVAASGRPRMRLCEGGAVLQEVECLVHPTPAGRPVKGYGAMWRLISHLSLNHLSLTGEAEGADALREILTLYERGHRRHPERQQPSRLSTGRTACRGIRTRRAGTNGSGRGEIRGRQCLSVRQCAGPVLRPVCRGQWVQRIGGSVRTTDQSRGAVEMANSERRPESTVSELLRREPYRFDFFQAVRLLVLEAGEDPGDGERRASSGIGKEHHASALRIRFGAAPSLAFSSAEIVDLAAQASGERGEEAWLRMQVAFLGLTGPSGALPNHYTTLIMERGQARYADYAFRDFLDIFNHRAISILFRAWAKHFPPWQYEQYRRTKAGQEDLFTFCLRCLVGLGTKALQERLTVDDEAVFYYSGHYAHFPRPAVSLEALLSDYFSLPVHVFQFCGRWLNLSPPDRSCLPSTAVVRGQNRQLGNDLVLGTRVWDVQTKFRIRVGPLSYGQFRDFLPAGQGLRRLCDLVRLYVGQQLEFDVQLVLRRDEIPDARLTFHRPGARRLGWDCWMRLEPFTQDTDRAIFREHASCR